MTNGYYNQTIAGYETGYNLNRFYI